MATELATIDRQTHLDPLALIEHTSLADSTKTQYRRVLGPYLEAGGSLADGQALVEYARTLGESRRRILKSALSLVSDRLANHIKAAATPANVAQAQATIMRLEALPALVETTTPRGQKAHTWLTPRQVRALMATCGDDLAGQRDRVVLGLLVGAGLRRAELAALMWDAITFQAVGERMRTVLEITGKGDKTRLVPVSDKLSSILDDWQIAAGREGCVARSLVASSKLGDSISAVGIFEIVRKHGGLIEHPNLAPHDLRRTYAQIGYDAGIAITQLSRLLGHASVATTQRYLNLELDLETTASDFVPL